MKLYTEEEIVNFLNKEFADEINAETFMENLTPIVLPSGEEIGEFINTFPYTKHLDDGQFNDGVIYGATIGIDWMRDKIQGGNNEQQ